MNRSNIKQQIEDAFRPLFGLPLLYVSRAASMVTIGFGEEHECLDYRGQPDIVATWRLHVQCPCRIVGPDGIVVGRQDMYLCAGDDPLAHYDDDDWDWSRFGANRYDERVSAFLANRKRLTVEAISADDIGGFSLTLRNGHVIDVFPGDSTDDEHWRLFNYEPEAEHFVVTGLGVNVFEDE